ncbi:uncharacterized protein TRIADDRAFT_64329 [Trichoplax adhaerens]|uniref:Dolichyl-diphosphooligosaccharide--protein glycosyltransferase subunit 2 n=1 Tax=Trichoplax adhaerens TaxID=10228 RepID=B3SAA0_TRIAD|nr:hypothetical protein TRIADDRAFT_64329 [Trichoplax adhaerens]EDV20480.1 hypothetical protein TRIADDRAFT_64329 [Trichoplax adhaerens]|eukprot:XP_002117174.1 hypothetical protein TRIADDRAFT_64329 [Trichoplax adhaerens]
MAATRGICLALSLFVICCSALQVDVVPENDLLQLIQKLKAAQPYKDLVTAYYSVVGLEALNEKVPENQDVCAFIKKSMTSNLVNLYFGAFIGDSLKCNLTPPKDAQKVLNDVILDGRTTFLIYQAVGALTKFNLKVDASMVVKSLKSALEKDDSTASHSFAFHAAAFLPKDADIGTIPNAIGEVLNQADEIGDKYLQFDGGIRDTILFVTGVYRLCYARGLTPAIDNDQAIKLANYIVSKRHVGSVRNAYYVALGLQAFTENKFQIPGSVVLTSQALIRKNDGNIVVKACNILGKPLPKMDVKATSIVSTEGNTIASDVDLVEKSAGEYQFDFNKMKPERGFYTVHFNVAPVVEDKRLIGLQDSSFKVKKVVNVAVESFKVKTSDIDQASVQKEARATFPKGLASNIQADEHSNVAIEFIVKDVEKNVEIVPQQAFLRLACDKCNVDRSFLFTNRNEQLLSLELDITELRKTFYSQSGNYSMDVIIGDPTFSNQIYWKVGSLSLKFTTTGAAAPSTKIPPSSKPEIQHVFRVPEKRPPELVSKAFTLLVLSPLVIMFVMWNLFGANVSNFSFTLPNIVFHLGVGAIFLLYYCYWTNLNMFTTLKYLAVIGGITFVSGTSVLRSIANDRMKKELR